MAHGFTVFNNNFQVLISNQTKTLHFVGKASYSTLHGSLSINGGMRLYAYTITCSTVPVPFFTMPVEAFYAVVGVRQTAASTWLIEVLQSGVSGVAPEVYVFTDPQGITYSGSETYGLRVLKDDGTVSFDSRLSPLVVTGGGAVAPPSSPLSPTWYMTTRWTNVVDTPYYSWYYSYADYVAHDSDRIDRRMNRRGQYLTANRGTADPTAVLQPTSFNTYMVPVGEGNTKPIYFFPSFAQSTRIASGDYFPTSNYRCISHYWALYRGGISYSPTTGVFKCGWTAYVSGNWWHAKAIDTGSTIGTGVDASTIVDAGAGGYPPYYNETLNLTPTSVIVANGTRYD